MNTTSFQLFRRATFAALLAAATCGFAQEPAPKTPEQSAGPAAPAAPAAPAEVNAAAKNRDASPAVEAPAPEAAAAPAPEPAAVAAEPPLRRIDEPETPKAPARAKRRSGIGDAPFGDHHVTAGSHVHEAVSVFGSSSVDGEVDRDVVSVFGETRVGPEGKVGGSAVAVLGRLTVEGTVAGEAVSVLGGVTINNRVGGDVVSVLGGMDLGPKAVIDGDIVVIGKLKKDGAAVVRGNVVHLPFFSGFSDVDWLVTWVKRCLLLGRPLAFGAHLGWAWLVALSFFALYLLLALIFPRGVEKCVVNLETRPGHSVLWSFLTVLLTPVAIVLLAVTVIGAVLVPFIGAGLLAAKLFGKAVMLAWIGRRFLRLFGSGAPGRPVLAVLVGGVLVLLLYTVPVLGFLLYKLLSWLGIGVVVYTVALSLKREKPVPAMPAPGVVAGAAAHGAPVSPMMPVPPTPAEAAAPAGMPMTAAMSGGLAAAAYAGGPAPGAAGVSSFGSVAPEFAAPPPLVPPAPPRLPVVSAATMPRAGFLIRMAALALDVVLIGLIVGLSNGLLPRGLHPAPPSILPLLAIYGAVMWKTKGTTIGGIVCGLKVVRLDDRPIDWGTAIVRALSCFLSLIIAGLGFIWVTIDDERQSWHDKIAGTTVVRVPKGISLL